ncbi:MAG: hypothetical protein EBQ89_00510 [Alphaproteobacteria bacterium]|nr:hypothetical protein [Alphaproteobacteria bacterium]
MPWSCGHRGPDAHITRFDRFDFWTNPDRAGEILSLVGSAIRMMTLTDCWLARGIACRVASLRLGVAVREELLRAFRMVEQQESIDRSIYAQMHIRAIVEKLTKVKRLSKECRRANVAADTVRRWAKDGITSLTDKLESFIENAGYVPESVFEKDLRKVSKGQEPVRHKSGRASEVAEKLVAASNLSRIDDEDLDILESMIDRLSRTKPPS